jgi:dolichol-phosphate mannosyltransferase
MPTRARKTGRGAATPAATPTATDPAANDGPASRPPALTAPGVAAAGTAMRGEPALTGLAPHERPVISVVAPAFNEAPTLPLFCERTKKVLEDLGEPWEIIIVDDGSTDGTRELIHALHEAEPRIKGLSFSKNFSHQIAITAGLDYARGDAIVIIDSDLQDPPEKIPDLVARWREGYQVVYAQRIEREGETWFKKLTATLFYRLIRSISNVDIPVDTGDFRLLDRRAADALRRMREHHRYVRGMAAWIGFRSIGVPYHRAPRYTGKTKYPLRRMIRFALDGITNFSYLPLQLASYVGFFVAGLSLLGIIVAIFLRLFVGRELTGQATTLVSVLFLGGVQLIFLGIIGEYLGRIYDEVKRRPLYIVDEMVGLAPAQPEQGADGVVDA